jgi:hypothetical protein
MKTNTILSRTSQSIVAYLTYVTFICFTGATSHGQGIVRITFDGPPSQPPGTAYAITNYSESGMFFTQRFAHGTNVNPITQFGRNGGGISGYPDDGSAFLQAGSPVSWLVSQFTDGSVFDFLSIDLAEYSTVVSNADTVYFVGYRDDNSTVSAEKTLDGIIDGTGPLEDFQTFTFQGFTGLSRLEISTSYGNVSLDNLVIAVPEPACSSLLLLGVALLYMWQHRRRGLHERRFTDA